MSTRKPLDNFAITVMFLLCSCWGLQQTAIKVAAPSISPTMQIALRSIIAAILVCGFVVWRGRNDFLQGRSTLWPGIIAGVFFAGEYICVSIGLLYTTASHMTVFLYTAPFFTALGLHWFVPQEKLRGGQFIGIAVAFVGVVLAFSGGFQTDLKFWREMLLGDSLGILGGIFLAATTVVIRRSSLAEAPSAQTLLYQLVLCGLILLPMALLMPDPIKIPITSAAWGSFFFQSVIFCFISLLVWFWMLRNYLVSRLAVFSFLTPLFGVGFGVLLLHDPISWQFASGAILVLLGIWIVNAR